MNKYLILIGIIITFFAFDTISPADDFNIIVKSKWRDLDKGNHHNITTFGGKWVLVASITFKKRCKEPIFIDALSFTWKGATISNLVASLYKKNSSKNFLPIEDNLICDGIWNKNKQSLFFDFDDKETLSPTTTFYLVLTVPHEIEHILMNGTFSLEERYLPKVFKQYAQTAQLTLGNTTPHNTQENQKAWYS